MIIKTKGLCHHHHHIYQSDKGMSHNAPVIMPSDLQNDNASYTYYWSAANNRQLTNIQTLFGQLHKKQRRQSEPHLIKQRPASKPALYCLSVLCHAVMLRKIYAREITVPNLRCLSGHTKASCISAFLITGRNRAWLQHGQSLDFGVLSVPVPFQEWEIGGCVGVSRFQFLKNIYIC